MTAETPRVPRVTWWGVEKPCPACGQSQYWQDRSGRADVVPTMGCEECGAQVQVHDHRDTLPGEAADLYRPV